MTAVFADISRSGSLNLLDELYSTSIVAVISLRNPDWHPEPRPPQYPGIQQLRRDLMIEDKPLNPSVKSLAGILKERGPKLHLREIPNIVAHGVGRALSCLVDVSEDDVLAMLPIRNALHVYSLNEVDVEECL